MITLNSYMENIYMRNKLIDDTIESDFQRVQKNLSETIYDQWIWSYAHLGRSEAKAILRRVGRSVFDLLGKKACLGLMHGIQDDVFDRVQKKMEAQEESQLMELREMLISDTNIRHTHIYKQKISSLVWIRGKMWAIEQARVQIKK